MTRVELARVHELSVEPRGMGDDERVRLPRTRTPPGGGSVRLTIPAKPEYITLSRLALSGLARVRAFSEDTLADLKLALTEACSNSVRHAYGDGEGHVDISFELLDDRLIVEVADDGSGFEPAAGGKATTTSCRKAVSGSRSSARSPTRSSSATAPRVAVHAAVREAALRPPAVQARRKLIVVSNRGPIGYSARVESAIARRGAGGLVTALAPLVSHHDVTWIASALSDEDRVVAAEGPVDATAPDGSRYRLRLVAHDPAAYDLYYHVVANPALWFVQHGLWELKHEPERRPPPGLGAGYVRGQRGVRRRSRRGAGPRSGHGSLLPRLPPLPGAERSCGSGCPTR